jgi:hypothetical protein
MTITARGDFQPIERKGRSENHVSAKIPSFKSCASHPRLIDSLAMQGTDSDAGDDGREVVAGETNVGEQVSDRVFIQHESRALID